MRRRAPQFSCPRCDSKFRKAEHLARHELRHSRLQPHRCSECGRRFARQDSLLRHSRLHMADATSQDDPTPHRSPPGTQAASSGLTLATDSVELMREVETWPMPVEVPILSTLNQANESSVGEPGPVFEQPHPSFHNDLDIWQLFTEDLLPGFESIQASPRFLDTVGLSDLFPTMVAGPVVPAPPVTNVQNSQFWLTDESNAPNVLPGGGGRLSSPPPSNIANASQGHSQHAVEQATSIVTDTSLRTTAAVSNPSAAWLDTCLHMFWTRFIPSFPVLHRPTFDLRSTSAPLLLNMISLGSLCLPGEQNRAKGVALWRLVHKGVAGSWDRLIELRGPHDACKGTQLLLTALLGQYYAMLSDDIDLTNTSLLFHGLGFRWAKLAGLLDTATLDAEIPLDADPAARDDLWRCWAARETQKRAMLGHYILDGCLISLFGALPTVRHDLNPLTLASDDELFKQESAATWWAGLKHVRHGRSSPSFSSLYNASSGVPPLGSEETIRSLSTMNRSIMLECVFATLVEWEEGQRVGARCGPGPDIIQRLAMLCPAGNPANQEDQAASSARWHYVCMQTALRMRKIVLPTVPVFSTSHGRRALLHANAILRMASSMPVANPKMSMMYLPICMFRAASLFVDYIAHLASSADLLGPGIDLAQMTDWSELGSCGLDLSGDHPTPTGNAHRLFVEQGGTPCIDGNPITIYDIQPLVASLGAFGTVWPRSRTMWEELVRAMM